MIVIMLIAILSSGYSMRSSMRSMSSQSFMRPLSSAQFISSGTSGTLGSTLSSTSNTVLGSTQYDATAGESNRKSYEYLDSGNQRRLERFGEYLVIRNCPSALWAPGLSPQIWSAADFQHDGTAWIGLDKIKSIENWKAQISDSMVFQLAPSEQGQVGIFPEQMLQWKWIQQVLQNCSGDDKVVRILNGFAYTGGSTLASLSGHSNVNVTHLDAASSAVSWAQRNVIASGHQGRNARFIVDDCMTFLRREQKRGKKYDGLIVDPPAFGRGGGNKMWKLEKDMPALVDALASLLSDDPLFLLLSCHDPAWPARELTQLLQSKRLGGVVEMGEMVLQSSVAHGRNLPLGSFARIWWPRR